MLSLQVVGTAVEGTTLHVNKEYWGGEEGESIFRWFRVHVNLALNNTFLLALIEILELQFYFIYLFIYFILFFFPFTLKGKT